MLQTDSSCFSQDFRNANEIVGGGGQHEEPFHQLAAAVPGLAQATDRLHPAERFLDALALDRADAIARVTRGARVDRGRGRRPGPRRA